MKTSNLVIWLSSLIAVLELVAASIGLFGQFIRFVASFAILTLYAIWFTLALFRNVSERISSQDPHLLDLV
jgi:uncharacterized membrane protein YphA (DoxX/SURF4 family)